MEAIETGYRACFEGDASDEFSTRVQNAIKNLRTYQPSVYIRTLQNHMADGHGSITPYKKFGDMENALLHARWEPYESDNIADGTYGAITHDIKGMLGIIALDALPDDTPIVLMDTYGDGNLYPTVKMDRTEAVDYTVLLFGTDSTDNNDELEYMRTFHPGEPLRDSNVKNGTNELVDGSVITVNDAKALGFEHAKIV